MVLVESTRSSHHSSSTGLGRGLRFKVQGFGGDSLLGFSFEMGSIVTGLALEVILSVVVASRREKVVVGRRYGHLVSLLSSLTYP